MPATTDFWKKIVWFQPEEFGIPEHDEALRRQEGLEMNRVLILKMDAMRHLVGQPIHIHAGFATKGHAQNSQHYLHNAADFHVEGLNLTAQFYYAMMFRFPAIGLYPFWKWNGKPRPGLHVDERPLQAIASVVLWWRDAKGTYHKLETAMAIRDVLMEGDLLYARG